MSLALKQIAPIHEKRYSYLYKLHCVYLRRYQPTNIDVKYRNGPDCNKGLGLVPSLAQINRHFCSKFSRHRLHCVTHLLRDAAAAAW
jgi:hypothetical protein